MKQVARVIQLGQRWTLGNQVGRGGFGQVFEAKDELGQAAAAKLIPQAPGADRELLFEDLTGIRNVVPILDSGEVESDLVLIMPLASKSLRMHLHEHGKLEADEVITIVKDLASALSDLYGKVVHRDIKPENVLLLDGKWCLSDFGIARYAEASTSNETHKWAWTSAYNAPERWRHLRATGSSDMYSLGVMAYEMLAGRTPFLGPDFREQHLHEDPPKLIEVPLLLDSLIMECLFKAPESRPLPANFLRRLELVLGPSSRAAGMLQDANQAQVTRLAKEAVTRSVALSAEERRRELVSSAMRLYGLLAQRVGQLVRENAPSAIWETSGSRGPFGFSVKLGPATLGLSSVEEAREDAWASWKPAFNVIAHAAISIRIPPDHSGYEGRTHSLWFADSQETGNFSWYETAFMISALILRRASQEPFALAPGDRAGQALAPALSTLEVAWPFTPIEIGNDHEFLERWMTWFALAAQGRLSYPTTLPEREPGGSWRRA